MPDKNRHVAGVLVTVFVISIASAAAWLLTVALPSTMFGAAIAGILAWPLVAARSMFDHVDAVRQPLAENDLGAARQEVAKIVGRDPESLDEAGVSRAALESLAENTSDGIVAPLFWGALLGLPGIAGYKAINTLDSMIGHKTDRFLQFGWGAARLDDLVNLIPARLTGLLFVIVARSKDAWRVMLRDAGKHRSPNAGWPEGAMAGALGVRLSGPRGYGGALSDEPWVNEGASDPSFKELGHALSIFKRTLFLLGVILALLALA